jgi:hypothetical protein
MWCIIIKAFGHDVPHRYGFKVSYIANFGRYLPGKIWSVLGMVYLLDKIGINKETALASWGVATIFGLPPAFLAMLITSSFYPRMLTSTLGAAPGLGVIIGMVAIGAVSLVLVFAPDRSMALCNFVLRLFRRPVIGFRLEKKVALQVYLGYFIGWCCYGVAFFMFVHAVMPDPQLPIVAGVGAFIMSYVIGYLAFFSPGGIGTRELVLTTVLTPFLGSVTAGVAVAARVWNLVTEVVAVLIALSIKMNRTRV